MGARSPSARLPAPRAWLTAALLALAACGGDSAPAAPGRTTWKGTFDAAMDALVRLDYAALHELLTPPGRLALEADLKSFQRMLADPLEGPRLMQMVRRRRPDVTAEEFERARSGSPADAFAFFLRATTPGEKPRQVGMQLDPANPDRVEVRYRYGSETDLPVMLVRVGGTWSIERLTLGSS